MGKLDRDRWTAADSYDESGLEAPELPPGDLHCPAGASSSRKPGSPLTVPEGAPFCLPGNHWPSSCNEYSYLYIKAVDNPDLEGVVMVKDHGS